MFLKPVKEADSRTVKNKGKTLFFYNLQSKSDLKPLLKCLDSGLLRLVVSFSPRGLREYLFFALIFLKRRFASAPRPGQSAAVTPVAADSAGPGRGFHPRAFKKELEEAEGSPSDKTSPQEHRPVSILMVGVGGGIGDMLILLAWVKEFYKQARFDLTIDAYGRCFSPHLTEHLAFINHVYQANDPAFSKSSYDLILKTTPHFIYPIFANGEILKRPEVSRFCDSLIKFTRKHYKYYAGLPRHDGSWSRYCSLMGLNRWDEYGAGGAFDFSRASRGIYPLDSEAHGVMERCGLIPGAYITLHAGFDAAYEIDRSTKVWPLKNWEELIRRFKEKYPALSVAQIGAKNSLNIGGADFNLLGKTSFREAAVVLKHSALHIDGESGLVHLRHIFGGQSVVLFGPTPADYFSYSENINLVSEFCQNCMWLTDDWFTNCPKGLGAKNCMAHISPEKVMAGVDHCLEAVNRKSSAISLVQPPVFFSAAAAPGLIEAAADVSDKCGLTRSLSGGRLGDKNGLLLMRPKDRLKYGYVLSQLVSRRLSRCPAAAASAITEPAAARCPGPGPGSNNEALAIALIGGGRGALGPYLASFGHQVKAFDLSFKEESDESPFLERDFFALTRQKGFEAELASPLNLPCGDEEFDLVCCSLNLAAGQVCYILREALRTLKAGGRLIVTFHVEGEFMSPASEPEFKAGLKAFVEAVNALVFSPGEARAADFKLDFAEAEDKLRELTGEFYGAVPMALGGLTMEKRPGVRIEKYEIRL